MIKQIAISLVLTLSVIGSLGYTKYRQIAAAISQGQARVMPPEAVTTIKVETASWPVSFSSVGTMAAVQGAVLAAQDIGRVSRIDFEPGKLVKQGQLLVELDTLVEEAELAGAIAQRDLAQSKAKRERALRERNSNSAADVDNAEAALRVAEASVLKLRAQIARKKISAPFPGRTGTRLVNEGQVVIPGTHLVSLQSFSPLYVNFSLPQQVIKSLSVGLDVNITSDSFPDEVFSGKITTLQPEIDASSRMLQVQGTVANLDEKLRPGMYVNVVVVLAEKKTVLQIPSSGILYAPYGDSVYIVETMKDPSGKEYQGVRRTTITLGEQRGDMVAVLTGLKAGDEVVSSGAFKLRPGVAITVNNSIQPEAELAPKPADT